MLCTACLRIWDCFEILYTLVLFHFFEGKLVKAICFLKWEVFWRHAVLKYITGNFIFLCSWFALTIHHTYDVSRTITSWHNLTFEYKWLHGNCNMWDRHGRLCHLKLCYKHGQLTSYSLLLENLPIADIQILSWIFELVWV